MTTIDARHRKLCHDLFDALEQGDVGAVDALYAPHMTFWANLTPDAGSSRADNLRTLRDGTALHRRRQYNDRIIDTFDDGFLARYTVNVVLHDGSTVALSACLVAEVHDGKIVRLWDYLDSNRFRPRRTKPRAEVGT